MTSFNPNGSILVAFEDGEVKLWRSSIPDERIKRIRDQLDEEKKHKKKQPKVLDLAEIGIQKFDIHDMFDMFENPHTQEITSGEDLQLKQLYGVSKILT